MSTTENDGAGESISIRLLLFAAYREMVGERILIVQVPLHARVEDVFERVQSMYPALARLRPSTRFAVNRTVVPGTHLLHHDDEVAFLQPVSGGTQ